LSTSVRAACEHMFVAYPGYVREKARKLRIEKHLSLDEIAARLALPRTTVYYWLRDMPLGRPRRWSAGQRRGTRNMQRKYALRRAAAYLQGRIEFADLIEDPTFRDFLCLYMAEGSKRSRNTVAVCNSDPRIVVLCAKWIRRFTHNALRYSIQYHADQNLEELRRFWAAKLAVEPDDIRFQRKSNSGRLTGRMWRSKYGVLTVSAGDTLLPARLEGWMHSLQDQWLDSPVTGA
jgi:AcrR family transcriptional regulator